MEEDEDKEEDDDDCNDFSQWTFSLFGLREEADLKHEPRWLPMATNSVTS